MSGAMTVARQFAIQDAEPRDDLRHPWDDGIFAALAERHGVRLEDMECDASILTYGWLWEPGDPATNRFYRLRGVPESMPAFSLQNSSHPKTFSMDLPKVKYSRWGGKRLFILEASTLPETIITCLKDDDWVGRPVTALVDVPGADGIAITRIEHRPDGYIDIEMDFGDEEMRRAA